MRQIYFWLDFQGKSTSDFFLERFEEGNDEDNDDKNKGKGG
jgi:hypothetical protein